MIHVNYHIGEGLRITQFMNTQSYILDGTIISLFSISLVSFFRFIQGKKAR